MEQDREKVADVTGQYQFMQKPEKHCFWYLNLTDDNGKIVKGKLEVESK